VGGQAKVWVALLTILLVPERLFRSLFDVIQRGDARGALKCAQHGHSLDRVKGLQPFNSFNNLNNFNYFNYFNYFNMFNPMRTYWLTVGSCEPVEVEIVEVLVC
jgi:hypothetical protein